jgi:toxin CptA
MMESTGAGERRVLTRSIDRRAGVNLRSMTTMHTQLANATGEYRVAPSRRLAAILAIGHCAVAALVFMLDFSPAWRAAILAALIASLVFELRTTALRLSRNSVIAIRISADNVLSAKTRVGEWRDCEVLGSTYVTAALTVLMLKTGAERGTRSVVLMPDSMTADDFRRLRMWLRWRPETKSD